MVSSWISDFTMSCKVGHIQKNQFYSFVYFLKYVEREKLPEVVREFSLLSFWICCISDVTQAEILKSRYEAYRRNSCTEDLGIIS